MLGLEMGAAELVVKLMAEPGDGLQLGDGEGEGGGDQAQFDGRC